MADRAITKLYTPALLSLATQLADFPLDREFAIHSEARSRTCGSTIKIGVDLGDDGKVSRIGLQVSACAVGQSSAAIMALGAKGRTPSELQEVAAALGSWLGCAENVLPEWPGIEALVPAREHTARHSALLLAWTAMTQALSSDETSR